MLNDFVELSTHEEEVDIKEMDFFGENLGQLIERCWQGTFSSQVLDGVAGHLLELVGKGGILSSCQEHLSKGLALPCKLYQG